MEVLPKLVASIGWPHVVLFFSLIFVIMFQKQIRDFIGRIRSVGKDGLRIGAIAKEQSDDTRQKAVDELMKLGNDPMMLELERMIVDDLKARNLETEGDTIKILIRHLAATQLALEFEQIHSTIFGSQIHLLKRLNEVQGQGFSRSTIENFFQGLKKQFAVEFDLWTLDNYLNFLFAKELITMKSNNILLTIKGGGFLLWIIRSGRNELRPL